MEDNKNYEEYEEDYSEDVGTDENLSFKDKLAQILRQKLIYGVVGVFVAIVILSLIFGRGSKAPKIYAYDVNGFAVDKKGEVLLEERNDKGELVIPEIKKDALEQVNLTEEDYKALPNPYKIDLDEQGNAIIYETFNYIQDGQSHTIMVQRGKQVQVDQNGVPILKPDGTPYYVGEQVAETASQPENQNTNTNQTNPTSTGNVSVDTERIDLTEEEMKEAMNEPEQHREALLEAPEEREKPNSVLKLDEKFYAADRDWSIIKETPYRALGVKPRSKSENPFIYYNWEGILEPYTYNGYFNRNVFGIALNYDFFKNGLEYDISLNPNSEDAPANLSVTLDRMATLKSLKKSFIYLQRLGVYPELEDADIDKLSFAAYDIVQKNLNISAEKSAKSYLLKDYEMKFSPQNPMVAWKYNKRKEFLNAMDKLGLETLDKGTLSRLYFHCYVYGVQRSFANIQKGACNELNEYDDGTCSNPFEISSLEIRSDFIQKAYEDGMKYGNALFREMVQDIQGELREKKRKEL